MNLTPNKSSGLLYTIQSELSNLLKITPSVDIVSESERYVIYADMPGVDPEEVSISLDNNILTIEGERKKEDKEESAGYHLLESFKGKFYRQFTLPGSILADEVEAEYDNGVLKLTVPKIKQDAIKKIQIQNRHFAKEESAKEDDDSSDDNWRSLS
jgi:HSP20 family protein